MCSQNFNRFLRSCRLSLQSVFESNNHLSFEVKQGNYWRRGSEVLTPRLNKLDTELYESFLLCVYLFPIVRTTGRMTQTVTMTSLKGVRVRDRCSRCSLTWNTRDKVPSLICHPGTRSPSRVTTGAYYYHLPPLFLRASNQQPPSFWGPPTTPPHKTERVKLCQWPNWTVCQQATERLQFFTVNYLEWLCQCIANISDTPTKTWIAKKLFFEGQILLNKAFNFSVDHFRRRFCYVITSSTTKLTHKKFRALKLSKSLSNNVLKQLRTLFMAFQSFK